MWRQSATCRFHAEVLNRDMIWKVLVFMRIEIPVADNYSLLKGNHYFAFNCDKNH